MDDGPRKPLKDIPAEDIEKAVDSLKPFKMNWVQVQIDIDDKGYGVFINVPQHSYDD